MSGDFNGDGRNDLAATGVSWWTTIPVALSNADGTFRVLNLNSAVGFSERASHAGAHVVSGDFDGDGYTDLLTTGGQGFTALSIAYSNGDGTFRTFHATAGAEFNDFSKQSGVKVLAGDFNGDGFSDLIATGNASWNTLPVAFSQGDGTFVVTNLPSTFNVFSSASNVSVVAGDFDGNGFTDLAATGGPGWASVPVAFSTGSGRFNITNLPSTFNEFSGQLGAKIVAGDFNADGKTDLAATGVGWWNTLPVAASAGDGSFVVTNRASDFNQYSSQQGALIFSR